MFKVGVFETCTVAEPVHVVLGTDRTTVYKPPEPMFIVGVVLLPTILGPVHKILFVGLFGDTEICV